MLRALGLLLTLFFFVFTANASDSPTDDDNLTKVFGPKKFKGQLRYPPTKTKRFSIQEPGDNFIMVIQNGKKFVPKDCSKKKRLRARLRCKRKNLYRKIRALRTRAWQADISINDQLLVSGRDINPLIEELRVPLSLEAYNIMKAKVKGLRGSFIKVSIFQDGNTANQAPLAVFSSELDPQNSLKYSFDASESSDDDGIVSFDWDFGDGNTASGETAMHEYAAPGEYAVTLTVTDTDGVASTASETLTVIQNGTPVAVANASTVTGRAPLTIVFNSFSSSDPDGDPLNSLWTFSDDNSQQTGPVVLKTFLSEGVFTVTLRTTDPHGAFTEDTLDITILPPGDNDLPVASFSFEPNRLALFHGEIVEFDASDSFDPDGQVNTYIWNFGDGSSSSSSSPTISHQFSSGAETTVTLQVVDNSGGISTAVSQIFVLSPPTDLITEILTSIEVPKGAVPLEIDFEALVASPFGEITTLEWHFDDDNSTVFDQSVVTHTFNSAGIHAVTLTAADEFGNSKTETVNVIAFGQDPIAFFEASINGLDASFEAELSGGPNGEIISYTWDFGDGSTQETSTSSSIEHTYNSTGTFNVTLTIEDSTGAIDTINLSVDIQ